MRREIALSSWRTVNIDAADEIIRCETLPGSWHRQKLLCLPQNAELSPDTLWVSTAWLQKDLHTIQDSVILRKGLILENSHS